MYETIISNLGQFGKITINGDHRYTKSIHGWIKGLRDDKVMFTCCENKRHEFPLDRVKSFDVKKFKPVVEDGKITVRQICERYNVPESKLHELPRSLIKNFKSEE